MITINIMGGLGNQMFQWACARNLQEKYGHYIKYNYNFYRNQNWRKPQLQEFKNIVFNSHNNTSIFMTVPINVGDGFHYDGFAAKDLSQRYKPYHLNGYWQSEKYFKENEDIIRNNLEIDLDTRYYLQGKYSFLHDESTTSLHVRRTDYVSSNGYHPVQSMDYYLRALDITGMTDKVLIFSDDIPWCKENFNIENAVFAEGNTNIQDLYLMSLCDNNIIANSSFSWWAAWLNNNPDKKIVAPRYWFGPGAPSDVDIIPEQWIRI